MLSKWNNIDIVTESNIMQKRRLDIRNDCWGVYCDGIIMQTDTDSLISHANHTDFWTGKLCTFEAIFDRRANRDMRHSIIWKVNQASKSKHNDIKKIISVESMLGLK